MEEKEINLVIFKWKIVAVTILSVVALVLLNLSSIINAVNNTKQLEIENQQLKAQVQTLSTLKK